MRRNAWPSFGLIPVLLCVLALLPLGAPQGHAGEPAAPAAPAPSPAAGGGGGGEPSLWPEPQRAFMQDGPGLLLPQEQRAALLAADAAGRERLIADFLEHGAGPGVAAATLREAIARRQRLARREFISPADVRAQLLFLNGTPAQRKILDCGTTFKPLEVWTYQGKGLLETAETANGTPQRLERSIVVYRPVADQPFRAWEPQDSKRVLYTSEMEYWLEQWEELRGIISARRFDLQLCKEARLVDRATGIEGLTGARSSRKDFSGVKSYASRPWGGPGERFLDPPLDLAEWVHAAAETQVAAEPPALTVGRFEVQFPERAGERILTRVAAEIVATGRVSGDRHESNESDESDARSGPTGKPGKGEKGEPPKTDKKEAAPAPAAPAGPSKPGAPATPPGAPAGPPPGQLGAPTDRPGQGAAPAPGVAEAAAGKSVAPRGASERTQRGEPGGPAVGLTVEGAVEASGKLFETFRVRYRIPAPPAGQPVTLVLDRPLRPQRPFVLRLKIKDDASGAVAWLARGFFVPAHPIAAPLPQMAAGATARDLAAAQQLALHARDTVMLVPPEDDVVFGLWRAEALVTGDQIAKVVFYVDGKMQLTRSARPYSVEVRLARLPLEQVVRAEGYDPNGQLIAADELVLNQPHGGLAVAILEPARGSKPSGKTRARADVTVPPERRVEAVEFKINDQVVAKLSKPPWETEITVPREGDTVYLSVVAQLDDGARAEDVRFLRSPQYVEELAVNLVELYTTVTDRNGQPVKGLAAEDFEVLEAGQPQNLSRFELVENLPLTLGILIDTSGSMASSLGEAQRAAGAFLERMVRTGDHCFTLTFSDRPVLRMPLTDDPKAAAQSLEKLQAVGSTSIHDAVVHSLYYYRGTHGQRALVLLSDGDDNTSQLTYDEALEYSKRSGVAIYVIGLNIGKTSVGIRGKLNRLTETTGGKVFYVSRAAELAGVYGEIEHELRSRYLLAFQSGLPAGQGGYRQIEVRLKKPGLKARTARGYYQ
ncbi:MAG TPA: VWA domain-containing protein [Thermoanaerobaculia bacterium]|nr:VWA domain-containing protein [Thermoanaerobaculia bacterium]